MAHADEDYSAGLSAFIEGNYELAQAHWLKSAKQENFRAMFNLGLLHDQNKLANSDPAKATRWFVLAGKGGYAAADYHHATRLIETDGDIDFVRELLERAASNGYQPAKTKLVSMAGASIPARSTVDDQNRPRISRTNINQNNYLGESWLLARSGSEWTIQLLAFQDLDKVRAFIDEHRLHTKAAYFIDRSESGVLYKLVYGAFQTKDAATRARDQLSSALQEHGPWLRTLAGVQEIINK